MGVVWIICKYKAPKSKFYCYFNVILINFCGIWFNLVLRNLIPESFAVFGKLGYRSLIDYHRMHWVIHSTLMMHDWKINAFIMYPSFIIHSYFLIDVEQSLMEDLNQATWKTDAQKKGYVALMM